jgi:hypothetical protein
MTVSNFRENLSAHFDKFRRTLATDLLPDTLGRETRFFAV